MLCTIGDLVDDVVVWLDEPVRPATDTRCRVFRHRGGSAANVAAFAAATGTPVRFIGQVGDDDAGRRLTAELARVGVDVRVVRAGRTGTIVVLVDPSGERSMLSDRGAAGDLPAIDPRWLEGVDALHLPVYSLVDGALAAASRAAASAVRAGGGEVTLDASSTSVLEHFGPARFRDLAAELAAAVLFANAAEAELLGALETPIAGVGLTIVKRGADPVVVIPAAGAPVEVAVPAHRGEALDTTGAGDAFAAGFLAAHRRGAGAVEAVAAGAELARATLAHPGATLAGAG
jgi:sugar/nucleoside kinase (ribokinase family)